MQIERGIFARVFEAKSNLGVAQAGFGGRTVYSGMSGEQFFFHSGAQIAADAVQIAGDAGFVLAEAFADGGESLLFGVIEKKAVTVARIEVFERRMQRAGKEFQVALAMRIERERLGFGGDDALCGLCVAVLERVEAAAGADGIDVALRENGAQPSF